MIFSITSPKTKLLGHWAGNSVSPSSNWIYSAAGALAGAAFPPLAAAAVVLVSTYPVKNYSILIGY